MAISAERKARNEGVFREANERLEAGAQDLLAGDDASRVPFICECPRPECKEIVLMTLAEYERARATPETGMAAVGHEDPTIERVVEENDRFVLTEKFGAAGEVHRQTDPRSDR